MAEQNPNPFEQAKRAVKVQQLVMVITVDAAARGKDWLSVRFVAELAEAGQEFWTAAAEKGGCHVPSLTTQQAVIAFFRSAAARAQSTRPTQLQAEA